jgi:hypothetical protein
MRFIVFIAFMALSIAAESAVPVTLNINPLKLTNGWKITGTITTDGTVGLLDLTNILDWNLEVVQTTDTVWTEKEDEPSGQWKAMDTV